MFGSNSGGAERTGQAVVQTFRDSSISSEKKKDNKARFTGTWRLYARVIKVAGGAGAGAGWASS